MRRAFVAAVAVALAALLRPTVFAEAPAPAPSDGPQTVEFEGKRWASDLPGQVTVTEYEGKTALCVLGNIDTCVYLPDVAFRDGTIEVDVATGSRAIPGIAFRYRRDGERFDRVMLNRWRRSSMHEGPLIEQAIVTRHKGTALFLRVGVPDERDDSGTRPEFHGWFHLKLVVRGRKLAVYLDDEEHPSIEVDEMLDGGEGGTLGVCGRNFYFANFRYTPLK
jgi:hypothetical protein